MSSRGSFSGQMGFVLAAAGSAVGLSYIWRFPYVAGQNGGAVFLIIYLACVFLFCYPVMVGEIAIGRASGLNAYGAYKKLGGKGWSLLGLMGVITGIIILSYYNVVAGWALGYFIEILSGTLLKKVDAGSFFTSFVSDPVRNLIYSMLFMAATAASVAGGIRDGIERLNKLMMPSLFAILVGLIGYSLTLPRAGEGISFYLIPDFAEINASTVFEALKLSFFTLSLGVGGLITYGSYLNKDQNIIRSSSIATWAAMSVAFLAGLMVFPLVFFAGKSPAHGPALVFVVMPEIFRGMPALIGQVTGAAFFLLLCLAAITSTVSLVELATAFFVDAKRLPRKPVVWSIAGFAYALGIPSLLGFGAVPALTKLWFYEDKEFLTLVADVTDISLTLGGCLMCIFIRYRWTMAGLDQELAAGNTSYTLSFSRHYLRFTIAWVCPALLALLTILIILDKMFGIFT